MTAGNNRPILVLAFLATLAIGYVMPLATSASPALGAGYEQIAVLAGVGGRITTLACYDPDPFDAHPSHAGVPDPWSPCRTTDDSPPDGVTGAHGGINVPTDISNSGSTVWVQVDYLPNAIRGGYIYAEDYSTGCFDPDTSGARTRAWIYYYDSTGQTDVHAIYYGHIDQGGISLDTWYHWNNAFASSPLWPG